MLLKRRSHSGGEIRRAADYASTLSPCGTNCAASGEASTQRTCVDTA